MSCINCCKKLDVKKFQDAAPWFSEAKQSKQSIIVKKANLS